MKLITRMFAAALFAFGLHSAAVASPADDAIAMVKKAAAHVKKVGKEKALADFNNSPEFKKGDLYLFVSDLQGKSLAHGTNPKLIGKDLIDLKDADGKPFVRAYIDVANGKGSGWVDYKWTNPTTKAIELKSSYIEKVDDMIIGCGIYK